VLSDACRYVIVTKLRFAFSVLRERKPPAMPDTSSVRSPVHGSVLTKGIRIPLEAGRQLPSSVASLPSHHFPTLLISTLKTEQYGSSKQRYLHARLHKKAPKNLCSFSCTWPCTPLAASTLTVRFPAGAPLHVRQAGSTACLCSQQSEARTSG
jgi:hypothetical protein